MRIWNAIRRFSGIGKRVRADYSVQRASKRQGPTLSSLINRGLRMEQFEERMLLSISPSGLSELWNVNAELARSIERATDLDGYSAEELASATQWVVGLSDADESSSFHALAANADYLLETPYLPNAAIWEFDSTLDWTTVADTLACDGKIDYYYPLTYTKYEKMFVPNDPLFGDQWHLENTGQNGGTPGMDVDVTTAWDNVLGTGVTIAIVDDCLQYDHPDLATNYRADVSWDFGQDDADPSPVYDDDRHGTSVAGVAAATGNNDLGVSGSAPDASIAGLRIDFTTGWTDYAMSQILTHENQEIDIYNNSWGTSNYTNSFGPTVQAAIEDAVNNGRDGLGNIYVFSSANSRTSGDNTSFSEYKNSRYTIAVAALDHNGHYSYYSTPGPSVFVSGYSNSFYSGITTTDLLGEAGYNGTGLDDPGQDPLEDIDYTSQFGGTSSSAPLVSGVIALILEANPNLTYRDVQHVLAESSTMNDPSNPSWNINGAGYHVSNDYGFGAANANAAVNLAYDWQNVSEEENVSSGFIPVNEIIPDASINGITRAVTIDDSIDSIEWVELVIDADHGWVGDLEISIISPNGTVSKLTEGDGSYIYGNLDNFNMTSCHFWGEASEGEWTIEVRDLVALDIGTFNNFELKIYGTSGDGPIIPDTPGTEWVGLELVDVIPNSGTAITEGSIQHVAPRELTLIFNEGQEIDPATIGAISINRNGGDETFLNLNDETVEFGYVAIGDRPNEIVIRFAEILPDDEYQLTILGKGDAPLATLNGTPFHEGEDLTITFNLDLGAQVTAIVPQPTTRDPNTGAIDRSPNTIEVYFNPDELNLLSAQNPNFYSLWVTNETSGGEGVKITPDSVDYDSVTNKAILTFAQDLDYYGTGAFRLRIGNEYKNIDTTSRDAELVSDVFTDALEVTELGEADSGQSVIISSIIEPQPYDIIFPGGKDELGHRDLPSASEVEGHYIWGADQEYGTTTMYYNFDQIINPNEVYYNQITEIQKQRTREIFELYSAYFGIDFIEDTSLTGGLGLTIATGDLRALNANIATGPGGVLGLAGGGTAIMDMAENWGDSEYDGAWFRTAMHEIGHLLGIGHVYDLPGFTLMGNRGPTNSEYYAATAESMYPGLTDIMHGQYIHKPDSIDVDVYTFTLDTDGTVSAEIFAERLDDSSLLDSVITIYDDNDYQMIARNDDYYSEDSYVELTLTAGTYYVAISSTGNTEFDPNVPCSGEGGTSQGLYDLRLTFLPKLLPGQADATEHMIDTTGTMFDGDADGVPGGVYNFWFDVQALDDIIFVDKMADEYDTSGHPLGSLGNPYTQIDEALEVATPGKIVRIVGNREQDFDAQRTKVTLNNPTDVTVGDFNNDSIPDLVTIAQGNAGVFYAQVYLGINGTDYWSPINYQIGTDPTDIKVADLDNDGAEDLIIVNSGESTLSLLMNNGDGSFAPQITRFTGNNPVAFDFGDLNGDGRLDLIIANKDDNTIGILMSNDVSIFADQVTYDVGSQPVGVTVGDVNNDARPDIISINEGDGSISVLLNLGENIFTGKTTFADQLVQTIDGTLYAGMLGDFDEDGTNDLALTNTYNNNDSLVVMIGNGDGTFKAPVFRPAGNNPTDIGIGDSDDDGHLDLFVMNQDDSTVSVFFGEGSGAFGPEHVYSVGGTPKGMAIADVDRNGRPDIITANSASKTISILTASRDQAYEIGYDIFGNDLEDGRQMEVPKDVTVMIDAGAVFKLRKANIDVGSSSQGIDRSEGALQVLGTPNASVYFTSYHDQTLGIDNATFTDQAVPGDWGGLVFRSNIDDDMGRTVLESEGIFVNYVNNAKFSYGGGQLLVNSLPVTFAPIHMIESRPTVTFNEITLSADAAMSADHNSFLDSKFQDDNYTADYDRVGPDIHGNLVIENSLNGLYVRVNTPAGDVLENLEIFARFDDTDIVHITAENFIVGSTPGGPILSDDKQSNIARTDGRLAIDPGIVLKLNQTRFETELGSQLIAEGTSELPIIFTSYLDTRYGIGGTFDTTNTNGQYAPNSGDWSGLYFGPASTVSLDNTVIAYGGGTSRIEGGFAEFNVIESHQANLRLTNSELEFNQGVTTDDSRAGREGTDAAVIYTKGSQPILTNNDIINNTAPAININANSLTADNNVDWGRSTGFIDAFDQYPDNSGPLVRENRLHNNTINGMLVRGEVLSTSSIWDDTDIVHVLQNEIVVPNFHTKGGLRLESAPDESLVVKLFGSDAGFTALGTPTEIDDRIGGTLQVLGMPGYPVVLTSLLDDTVGAGVDPWDQSMLDTDNQTANASSGDWRSVKLEEFANDRNVAVVNEFEASYGLSNDINHLATNAQYIGLLAPDQKSGDDNLRLGFDIQGFIRSDDKADADVYAFNAEAGTEVWFDIDATSLGLNSVIELIDGNGNIYARSVNSAQEDLGAMERYGEARTMDRDVWDINDQYTTNLNDAGMRVVLPGAVGTTLTYYLRVSSDDAASRGGYQLQVRLQETQEIAGSTVQKASIRYATNGIELLGLPTNSMLTIDAAEITSSVYDTNDPDANTGTPAKGSFGGITVTTRTNGIALNGIRVNYVEDASLTGTQNSAQADYSSGEYMITVTINPGYTTAGTIASAINSIVDSNNVQIFTAQATGDVINTTGIVGRLLGGTELNILDGLEDSNNDTFDTAQDLGNLLVSDMGQLEVAGYMSGVGDIDWYSFALKLDGVQSSGIQWPAIFDVDYADGMARPDLVLYVYDWNGTLLYIGDSSAVADDQPDPLNGPSMDELMRGSFGSADPFIGPVSLLEGTHIVDDETIQNRYYVAVSNRTTTPTATDQTSSRVEPIHSLTRIVEDQIGQSGGSNIAGSPTTSILYDITPPSSADIELNPHVDDYTLGDVVLYVSTGNDLYTINPYTGVVQTDVTETGNGYYLPGVQSSGYGYRDIVMRNDGRLYSMTAGANRSVINASNQGLYSQFSPEDGRLLSANDDGIKLYYNGGEATEEVGNGIHFEAMAYIPDSLLGAFGGLAKGAFIAVGNNPLGGASGSFTENLLYVFDSQGNAVQHSSVRPDPEGILPSNILPWGQVVADRFVITVDPASAIFDGKTVSFSPRSGSVTFEYDLGLVAELTGTPKNTNTFTINDSVAGVKTFEFNTGPVIKLNDYSTIVEGTSFTLFDDQFRQVTFEFDMLNDGTNIADAVAINLQNVTSNDAAGQIIAKAINDVSDFSVVATYQDGIISLENDTSYSDGSLGTVADNIVFDGAYGVSVGNIAIDIEANMDTAAVLQEILTTATAEGIEVNTSGDLIAFPDATAGNFSGTADLTQEGTSANGVAAGNYAVELELADSADTVASKLAAAINAAGTVLSAIVNGDTLIVDSGANGMFTGLTYIDNVLYATDDIGNIFVIDGANTFGFTVPADDDVPDGTPKQVGLNPNAGPVLSLLGNYNGIAFSGLEQGPLNAEGSIYDGIMFAVGMGIDPLTGDSSQVLFAVDIDGNPVPVFVNGQSTIAISGLESSTGLAFSTLDYNLWHVTSSTTSGNTRFWFGYESNIFPNSTQYSRSNSGIIGTYDLPGGAHGTLTTDTFSLAGYSADDLPLLTFNYFLETDGNFGAADNSSSAGPVTDTARVFISSDGTTWTLLASNTSRTAPDSGAIQMVDSSGIWQQCEISLGSVINGLSDLDNLRLKFEFTTSGSMGTGYQDYDTIPEESIMKVVAGNEIIDGDFINIVGLPDALGGVPDSTIFEYDMGYSFVLPNSAGQAINHGDKFTIDGVSFAFAKVGSTTDPVADHIILIDDGDATFPMAKKIEAFINSVFVNPNDPSAPPFAYTVGDRIYIPAALDVPPSSGIQREGNSPGTITGDPEDPALISVGVPILPWMSAEEVARLTVKAINEHFLVDAYPTGGTIDYSEFLTTVKQDGSLITFALYTINDSGPHSNASGQPGDDISLASPSQVRTSLVGSGADAYRVITSANPRGTQYHYNLGAQDNQYAGFYVDDITIGFVERGVMVTDVVSETDFRQLSQGPWLGTVIEGHYQLTIRTASEYTAGTPFRSFDTNDRNTEAITLLVPEAGNIANNDSFTVNDGVKTQTFQFVDRDISGEVGDNEDAIPIYYSQGQSAQEIAASIAQEINNANNANNEKSTAITADVITGVNTPEDGSNRVDLFYAASVEGIDNLVFDSNGKDIGQVTETATNVALVDVTGDDLNDIITVNASDQMVRIFQGVLAGAEISYHHQDTFTVGAGASDIATVDLNGDGLLDIIVTNYGDATVSIAINSGAGYFAEPITIETGNAPSGIAIADFDGNEALDLAVTSETQNAVYIHLGKGDGTFLSPTPVPVGIAPKDLVIGLLDGDDYPDIVTVNSGDNSVSVLLGDGLGNFPIHNKTSVGCLPVALAIGDLNGDNRLDIGTANRGDNTISVLLNNGAGMLYAPNGMSTYTVGEDPVDIQILDITDDGVNDIGVVNYGNSTLTNYMGLGSLGPFAETLFIAGGNWNIGTFSTRGGPTSFVYGDISGKFPGTTQEMLISDTTGQSLSMFMMTPDGPKCITTNTTYSSYAQEKINLVQLTGDTNHEREQGYIVIESNEIMYAAGYGISSDAGTLDYGVHPGAVAPLREVNTSQLVPGISISNNLIVDAGGAGIYFSGSPNADSMDAAIPFGRITNNTIYDCGTGIMVTENASPTILNNILSNNRTGIAIDATCQSTVVGGTVYHENSTDVSGISTLGNFSIVLEADDPLFVNPENNNFYLAKNSQAIDSAIDSLEERDSLLKVVAPLGIAPSPILAPEDDLYGQQRSDDPSMDTPPGFGLSPFKDRGAIDRVDFTAPTSSLIDPFDNDPMGIDRDPSDNDVFIAYERVSVFSIQLYDPVGAGIDDSTVVSDAVKIYKDGSSNPLSEGKDYFFRYDTGTNVIRLYPGNGLWKAGSVYEVVLNNSTEEGIADIAGNPVRANRYNGMTTFNISVASFDYGDAPDNGDAPHLTYPSLFENDGARHLQIGGYYLGTRVTGEGDANLLYDEDDGSLITDAKGDVGDDGVVFGDSALMIGSSIDVTITASLNGGYLSAWVDFNADGDWDDPGEQIFTNESLDEGENTLTFNIPAGLESTVSYARFRYSTQEDLMTTGEAPDGEVEDYQIHIVSELLDFGDAPEGYSTILENDGARHETGGPLFLGDVVDNELDGRAHQNALGDDQIGFYNSVAEKVINDEDGIEFRGYLVPGGTIEIDVDASIGGGYLNAWIDYNGDGDWGNILVDADERPILDNDGEKIWIYDDGEFIVSGQEMVAGINTLTITVPTTAVTGSTFARFRLSSTQYLDTIVGTGSDERVRAPAFAGQAPDGEVEDYAIVITEKPRDFGDAPRSYKTRETAEAASLLMALPGKNNDIIMVANMLGTEFNGVKVSFVNEIAYGDQARVTFNLVTKSFLIDVDPEATTANAVIDAINEEGTFIAQLDVINDINNNGTGLIDVLPGLVGTTAGGYDGFGTEATSHILGSDLKLGERIDAEVDGIPTDDALGDDLNASPDEDGFDNLSQVRFVAGEQTTLDFTAMLGDVDTAYLSAWVDFNQDGVFSANEQVVVDQTVTEQLPQAEDPKVTITVPIEALAGDTYVRFRISSQEGLDWYGEAPDGEVEDYQINILKGDAAISGVVFQDRNFNTVWDTGEEGRVGIVVYIDLDAEGEEGYKMLDYDDINGNGTFDIGIDVPTEPYAVSMDDDPGTLDVDETGYYEFSGLFGQVDAYTVRQITPNDSLLTYPNGMVTLPDGSHGNNDGSYSIFLEGGELVSDVNFGFFEKSHVRIDDIVVAEGNEGYKDVTLTVTLTHSFGADLTFSYLAHDGDSLIDSENATTADNDYEPKSGTFTFDAQDTPVATWSTTVLTTTASNNYDYAADGQFAIWEGYDGHDWEIYLFAGQYDAEAKPIIHQLTDNTTDDRDATVFASTNLDGTFDILVAWTGLEGEGSDTEVFLYEGDFNADGSLDTASTRRLTDNVFDDTTPQLSETYVTWWGNDGQRDEVFYFDIANGSTPQNLTANDYTDKDPIIQGSNIVWVGDMGRGNELFLFTGKYDDFDNPIVTQITNNYSDDQAPQIDDNYIVWEGKQGSAYQIFVYQIDTATTTQITTSNDNRYPQISGKDVVWQGRVGADWEVFHYNIDAETAPVNISNNNFWADDRPEIIDEKIVWRSFNGSNYEVYYHKLRTDSSIVSISGNTDSAWYPHITDSMAIWRSYNGTDYDIVIATQDLPEITKTITLRVIGDTKIETDEAFQLTIQAVEDNWVHLDKATATITILNDDGAIDFGDAPASYSTLLVDNGARHLVSSTFFAKLGQTVDVEKEGQASANSKGDDNRETDDEDGVTFTTVLGQDSMATVVVNVTASAGTSQCFLDAWIDFKQEGNWDGLTDKIFDAREVSVGENTLTFQVPADAVPGLTNARFRLSNTGGLNYTGQVTGGEVEDYQVEIVAKPNNQGQIINLAGTSGNDTFIFTAGNTLTVDINGAVYYYDSASISEILFDGGAGNDTVIFNGSTTSEAVEMWTNRGHFTGNGYTVTTSNVESISAVAGSTTDTVTMHGSTGSDAFVSISESNLATLSGVGFALRADGFKTIAAFGAGGDDQAKLYGSTGYDTYQASPNLGQMISAEDIGDDPDTGDPILNVISNVTVNNFRYLSGYAIDGEEDYDYATITDSAGDDTFAFTVNPEDLTDLQGQPNVGTIRSMATMVNSDLNLAAYNFPNVIANSTEGIDSANMVGSPGDDKFTGSPSGFNSDSNTSDGMSYAKLVSGTSNAYTYGCLVNEFRYATASAKPGSGAGAQNDIAYLYDSQGSDTLTASPTYAKMAGEGFYYRADFFNKVIANSDNGGEDAALLYDSTGDDEFFGASDTSYMRGLDGSYSITANDFKHLNAYAGSGGKDSAILFGSSGNDTYFATPSYGKMSRDDAGSMSYYRAYSFQTLTADAMGGDNNVARLLDSALQDLLKADGSKAGNNTHASISNEDLDFVHEAYGFEEVHAYSTSAGDKKDVESLVDFLFTEGLWDDIND